MEQLPFLVQPLSLANTPQYVKGRVYILILDVIPSILTIVKRIVITVLYWYIDNNKQH